MRAETAAPAPATPPTTPTGAGAWVAGARPRTLSVALMPVVVGCGVAVAYGHFVWNRALLALVVSLVIQIGTNFANDYSDGVRGTDTVRVGPVRLVAGGLARPGAVRAAAWASYFVAAAAGLALAVMTSLWLIPIGAACVAAGWFYTGGRRPYGYIGLGELFVFVFFGLVAVVGTVYVNVGHTPAIAWVAAVPVGLLAVALLVVNNLRDLENDAKAGKKTLAVRFGERRTRLLFEACVLVPFVAIGEVAYWRVGAVIAFAALALAARPVQMVHDGATGRELVRALGMTGRLGLVFGVLLAVGIAL